MKILNIKEQIENLPLDFLTKNRILELTIKANAYDVINHVSKFNLPQAFDWNSTREGGDYWLKVFIELEKYDYAEKQKIDQENQNEG
jgi:hypothetical protein